jgi:hypothetical protein
MSIRSGGVKLADDLPNFSGHSGTVMLKLIAAWIAMRFSRPEITWGKTSRRAE